MKPRASIIQALWDRAFANPGVKIPVGAVVVCDICDADYTTRPESGGFMFGSYAYCPRCAEHALPTIRGFGEENHIRARCPPGKSFADFIRDYRGPDAFLRVGKA